MTLERSDPESTHRPSMHRRPARRAALSWFGCAWACVLAVLPLSGWAQGIPPTASPDLPIWAGGTVDAMVVQADGAVVVGGDFQLVDGDPRRHLFRLTPDGAVDPGWTTTTNGRVTALVQAADGAIYVAGDFTQIGGIARQSVARLSPAGVVDPNWNIRFANSQARLRSIARDATGRIYLSGEFSQVLTPGGPVTRERVARFDAAGVLDPTWNPVLDGAAFAMQVDPAGQWLYIGGEFNNVGTLERVYLARLALTGEGAADPGWRFDTDEVVNTLAFAPDGRLHVGGAFRTLANRSAPGLARFDAAGAVDAAFAPDLRGTVRGFDWDGAGRSLVAGDFVSPGTPGKRFLVRLLASGAVDPGFDAQPRSEVRALRVLGADRIAAAGSFVAGTGTAPGAGVALLAADGSTQAARTLEVPGAVQVAAAVGDGLVVGGRFRRVGDAVRGNVARLRADGSLDPAWRADTDGPVSLLSADGDGAVFLGGEFASVDGLSRQRLARVLPGGGVDPAFVADATTALVSLHAGASGSLYVCILPGGQVGGEKRRVARLDRGGRVDPAWVPFPNGNVLAFHEVPGQGVYLGGVFTNIGGEPRGRVARLRFDNADVDRTWTTSANTTVNRILPMQGGVLLLTGNFSSINGTPTGRIALVQESGSGALVADWSAPGANGVVSHVARIGDTLFAEVGRRRLLRFDATSGAQVPNWQVNANGDFRSLAAVPGSTLLWAAGDFTTIGGAARRGLAAFNPDVIMGSGFE